MKWTRGSGLASPLLGLLGNHAYPQKSWAREIVAMLDRVLEPGSTVVDAPCGSGVVSLWVSRWRPSWRFELVDRSEESIRLARARLSGSGALVRQGDVREISVSGDNGRDAWLIVNSLFLLERPAELIVAKRDRFAHTIVVCDEVCGPNYEAFYRDRPWLDGESNRGAVDMAATCEMFDQCGYELVERRGITFWPVYVVGENPLALVALNHLDGLARIARAPANYWIGLFRRREGRERT